MKLSNEIHHKKRTYLTFIGKAKQDHGNCNGYI